MNRCRVITVCPPHISWFRSNLRPFIYRQNCVTAVRMMGPKGPLSNRSSTFGSKVPNISSTFGSKVGATRPPPNISSTLGSKAGAVAFCKNASPLLCSICSVFPLVVGVGKILCVRPGIRCSFRGSEGWMIVVAVGKSSRCRDRCALLLGLQSAAN